VILGCYKNEGDRLIRRQVLLKTPPVFPSLFQCRQRYVILYVGEQFSELVEIALSLSLSLSLSLMLGPQLDCSGLKQPKIMHKTLSGPQPHH